MTDDPDPSAEPELLQPMHLAGSTKPTLQERFGVLLTVIMCGAIIATVVIAWRMMSGG